MGRQSAALGGHFFQYIHKLPLHFIEAGHRFGLNPTGNHEVPHHLENGAVLDQIIDTAKGQFLKRHPTVRDIAVEDRFNGLHVPDQRFDKNIIPAGKVPINGGG